MKQVMIEVYGSRGVGVRYKENRIRRFGLKQVAGGTRFKKNEMRNVRKGDLE